MTVQAFPFFGISGAPRERGRQYGRQARDRIEVSLSIYHQAFDKKQIAWSEVRRRARDFMPRIAAYDATLLEEIEGIAEGADVEVERIVALNARTELLYGAATSAPPPEDQAEGCTSALALPATTADGLLIHGQNWDWISDCVRSAVVVRIDCGDGNPMLSFMEAGMLARAGFNAAGLALTGNFLASDRDRGRPGVPIPLLRRRILRSNNLGAAVGEVYLAPRAFSNNLMISHVAGVAVDLETAPDEVFWLKPQDGLLVHSNHFKTDGARAKLRDVGLEVSPDSLYRDDRVQEVLAAHRGRIDVEHFKTAFRDNFGLPKAVCRIPTPGPGGTESATVATIIMKPAAGRMWIAPQPYAGGDFTEYSLHDR
jgi:isopenicillin-N N-acyltransferase-like protein